MGVLAVTFSEILARVGEPEANHQRHHRISLFRNWREGVRWAYFDTEQQGRQAVRVAQNHHYKARYEYKSANQNW